MREHEPVVGGYGPAFEGTATRARAGMRRQLALKP